MNNSKKHSGLSPLALILIITASIVAAVGIVFLVMNIIKKRRAKTIEPWCDDAESWELDDDLLDDLRFDDEEDAEASDEAAVEA